MAQTHLPASLLPLGLIIEWVRVSRDEIFIGALAAAPGRLSSLRLTLGQLHIHYDRRLLDLSAHGRQVRIRLSVQRFRCGRTCCPRRILAERVKGAVAHPFARRTVRPQGLCCKLLGLLLAGVPEKDSPSGC